MTKALRVLVKQKKEAIDKLENEILSEMVRVAKRKKLTRMRILPYGNCYERGEEGDVDVPELDRLDDLYLVEVNESGFEAVWTADKGWR